MNVSTAMATVVVDELVRHGVQEAVLSPGSRNAPLAFALHDADRKGRLRLHVRIDERTAGFLALGLAKTSGRPVPVVTTSGTAAVNLHPAMVEASHAHVPVVALTADRPREMRGVGANQTIDQQHLFGAAARSFTELSVDAVPEPAGWRRTVAAVLAQAADGPVHVNLAMREPLVPEADPAFPLPLDPPLDRPQPAERSHGHVSVTAGGRTVVVAGDGALPDTAALAETGGWPLLAEPSSGARTGPNALAAYRLALPLLAGEVERVVVSGRPTLSRPVTALLARGDVEVVRLPRDLRRAQVLGDADPAWLDRWLDADRSALGALTAVLADEPPSGPSVARAVAATMAPDALLVAGSSSAVRDLDLADPWPAPPVVLANRGASGIDGTVSTAVGAALAHQRDGGGAAVALVGDLTFLHDWTGLVLGPDEPVPDLTVVVVDDDGGALFSRLEQGDPEHRDHFERLFGTPHGVDLQALCAATGVQHVGVPTTEALVEELARVRGLRVVSIEVDRGRTRDLHAMLQAAVDAALRQGPSAASR